MAPPRETAQPPAGPSPTGGDWKLLTPEDLAPAVPQTSATPDAVNAESQLETPTPEPTPPQSSDHETIEPSQESQPPTVDALPSADEASAPTNDQSGTDLFSAPDLDLPPTTDDVGSDPAAAVPETETPAVDVPVADPSEINTSISDPSTTKSPATTPAAIDPTPVAEEPAFADFHIQSAATTSHGAG